MKTAELILVTCLCLFFSTHSAGATTRVSQTGSSGSLSEAEAKKVIAGRAREVLQALKGKDMNRLSSFVHPRKGVRFSPYNYVEAESDLVFSRKQVKGLLASRKRYLWGAFDGSGDPIRLTFRAYHKRFIYDVDFLRAKQVAYNGESLAHGNAINNIRDSYPRAIIVEHYIPGTNPKYDGMDWRSLWLVFEEQNKMWYLVGVAHGEWTI